MRRMRVFGYVAVLAVALGSMGFNRDSAPSVRRYVSLARSEVNMREGPSFDHKVMWVYHREGLPLLVLSQYDIWRRVRDSEGTIGWVQSTMLSAARSVVVTGEKPAPMRDARGAIVQWNVICLDIDPEVRAQQDLQLAQERLARASQAASLAELSASIAHEVNQPLAAIVANSHACHRWLSAEPANIERAKITAERIVRNANTAADIVSRTRALFSQSTDTRTIGPLDDVVAETADISFGDAWVEPYSSDGRGANVVIVRTKALRAMIEAARGEGRLELEPVGTAFVIETQAAGLRHRREGLAYRLSRRRRGIVSRKRVAASARLPLRRKLIYRMRYSIAGWSHRIFRLARGLQAPNLYLLWARTILRVYQALAWSRGPLGKAFDVVMPTRRV